MKGTSKTSKATFKVLNVPRQVLPRLDYGDDVLFSSGLTRGAFDEEACFLLAAKLYEMGRLSSGLAAKLCGKGRVDFLFALPRIGVAMSNLQPEDLASEVEFMGRG